jgi:hypothetical protein
LGIALQLIGTAAIYDSAIVRQAGAGAIYIAISDAIHDMLLIIYTGGISGR